MSTNAFARSSADPVESPVHPGENSKPHTASATALANEARFAVTGEDISSLATFVPVGLLALISFGAMLTSH
ncbi:MAG: hypothetical protein WA978_05655 [Sphingopyxis granuli]|uniref:hypothetical protein n=1 Tax=Sphingopyxis granuli TaxID=267128 RepID=UPI003C73385B